MFELICQQKVGKMSVMVERFIEVDGAKLRELRRRRMLSLRELGERSRVAFDNINKLENEKRRAQPRTLRKLADALDVEPRELMKGDDDE
jgi:transcriptional regulator with XRE-family HTH domain